MFKKIKENLSAVSFYISQTLWISFFSIAYSMRKHMFILLILFVETDAMKYQ